MSHSLLRLCALVFWLVPLAAPNAARSQDSEAKTLAMTMAARQTASVATEDIERLAARIFYVQARAILSVHGDWPEERQDWSEDTPASSFVYQLAQVETRFRPDVLDLRRTAGRSGIFTEEETERVTDALFMLDSMIDQSQELYSRLRSGELQAANAYLRDTIRPTYEEITASTYTIAAGIRDGTRSLSLQARLLD